MKFIRSTCIYLLATLAALIFAGMSALGIERLRDHYLTLSIDSHRAVAFSDVYVHHGDGVSGRPFHPGDAMFAHYKIERFRTCLITLQFRLTMVREGDRYTGRYSFGYPMVAYFGPPASLETNEYFEIPKGMPPGHYELRRFNVIKCDHDEWVEFAPPASLDIV